MNSSTSRSPSEDDDPFDLSRFVAAQRSSYEQALLEVQAGRKRSHWMWYVFPQLRGLGASSTSQLYGISGTEEARSFLNHEILGPRLMAVCAAALSVEGRSATEIFGKPDDVKLRSCATLFAHVSKSNSVFHQLIDKFFDGQADPRTTELLRVSE